LKYAAGRRVAPLRVALPFQTVETVNESAQDRQSNLQFGPGFREEEWRNRLIWGDKKYVLPSLLPEFAGRVNLIYIDPPFDTGADFSFYGDGAGESGLGGRRLVHVYQRAEHHRTSPVREGGLVATATASLASNGRLVESWSISFGTIGITGKITKTCFDRENPIPFPRH
jgi:hypothetical protein